MSDPWFLTIIRDVSSGLPEVAPESVDVVVTSPPYFDQDGYSEELMQDTGELLSRVLKPGGRAFVNVGPSKQGGFWRPFDAAMNILHGNIEKYGHAPDLWPWQTILWVKSIAIDGDTRGHFQSITSDHILNYCHEYIFQFVKSPVPGKALNRLSIGVPYKDKSNLKRGDRGKNGDVHCGGDTWFLPYETTGKTKKKAHDHAFPLALPIRCIKLANLAPGGVVMDPFSGGGTTAQAGRRLGFNVIANDVSPMAIKRTIEMWEKENGSTKVGRWVEVYRAPEMDDTTALREPTP